MADEDEAPDPHSPTPDVGDKRVVEARNRDMVRRDRRIRATLAGMLTNRDVREWLWDHLTACNVYQQSFVQGEPDSTAFNEGKRSIGNRLIAAIVAADPASYVTMMKESGNLE